MVGRSQTSTDTMSVVTPEMQQLELVRQLWLPTRNASGLGFDPVANHGDAWFGVFHSSGDYHKAQEGSRMNGLNFLRNVILKLLVISMFGEVSSSRWIGRASGHGRM